MSVARLRKLSLVGRQADKEPTLRRLQELGALHLIALTPPESHPEKAVSREAEDAYKALRFLAVVPEPRRQVRDDPVFDTDRFVAETLALKADYLAAIDRREALLARLALMRPWGDFQFPEPGALGGQQLWFYELPMKSRASLGTLDLPWTIVHQEPRTLFVVVIAAEEPAPDAMPVPRVHLGSQSMAALSEALDQVELEIEDLSAERHARTRFLVLLRARLSEAETAAEMAFALSQIQDDPDLFAVQGWVPEDRLSEIESYGAEAGLALLVEQPQPGETPPTLLDQPEDASAGVSLAMFYQVPSYRGWDPTLLLVISFAIFFAMILADAGYGIVLLLLTIAVWRRLDGTAQARSWRRLFLILSGSTIAYGALVGSYFGAGPPDALPVLSEVVALDLNDFGTMMGLSIFIGVLHLAIAHFMAFRAHAGRARWANLAWIAILFGGYAVWISGQTGLLFVVGAGAGLGGLLALILFSSERPVEHPRDWALRLLDGIAKLSGLMGMFGDVLSYMRLFALGLASASLAITFNDLASQVMASRSGLAFLGGLLILLIGHVLNFGLGLMSGVVHGLRLNYIEFYKWGLPEEGTAFRAFARKEVQE